MSDLPTALRPAPWVRTALSAYRLEDGVLMRADLDEDSGEIREDRKVEVRIGLDDAAEALASALRERDALLRNAQTSRFALAYLLDSKLKEARP